jgi:hypothetical protein
MIILSGYLIREILILLKGRFARPYFLSGSYFETLI